MALQNVIVMHNSMKVVYKWKKSGCVEVKKQSHEGPNLAVEKTNVQRKQVLEMSGKNSRRYTTHFCCSSTGFSKCQGTLCRGSPKDEV